MSPLAEEIKEIPQKSPEKVPGTVTLTMGDIKDLIAEIKKPSELEQEKIDQERQLRERRRRESIALATLEMEQKALKQSNCNHTKPNGKPCIGGQIHSDGMVHMICLRCQKEFTPTKPDQGMLATGI